MRKRTGYLTKFSTTALVWLALLGALRLLLPLSFPFTFVVRSFEIMPAIESVLETDLWPGAGRFELQALLLLMWGAGAVVVPSRSAIMFRKDYMRRRGYRIVESAQVDRILQRLRLKHAKVVVSPDIGVPYVTGLVSAKIYLPNMEISDDMLEVIIKHEYRHFLSRDILIRRFIFCLPLCFGGILLSMYFCASLTACWKYGVTPQ